MGAPGLIAGSMAAGGIMSAIGQGQSASAQSNYYNYLSSTSLMNAGLAKAAGRANIQAVGAAAADQMRRTTERVRQTIGAQKVAMVSGVGAGSRSGQDIIKNTLTEGNLDEQAINMNAEMKQKAIFAGASMAAFNDVSQAGGYQLAGQNVKAALPFQQASTLLGASTQAASQYYLMNMYGAGGGGVPGGGGNIGGLGTPVAMGYGGPLNLNY